MPDYELATPKPAALIESLRAIGYNLPTAVADIIDNSISAEAKNFALASSSCRLPRSWKISARDWSKG
jgi:hypothetical protein